MASEEVGQGGAGDGKKPSKRSEKKLKQMGQRMVKEDAKIRIKRVKQLLKKLESERTPEEKDFLSQSVDEVIELQKRTHRNKKVKDHKLEKEEDDEEIEQKSKRLAEMLASAKSVVVYTGAGISTAASIPDYRGPNGVWTMMNKGKKSANAGTEQALQLAVDISKAEPTFTHMAIAKLSETGIVKHVVSQNCDGLHLRSGMVQNRISEIHGNMNIEVCSGLCAGVKRLFIRNCDVTKKTSFRRHFTDNYCTNCGSQLKDTIIHFGEKGPTEPLPPHHWPAAARAARKADLIVCIGSSLKILRKYSCLWNMEKKKRERARIVIVNLQWTPKDNSSSLKINGKCDDVMGRVMNYLRVEVPSYARSKDPIFGGSIPRAFTAASTPSSTTSTTPSIASTLDPSIVATPCLSIPVFSISPASATAIQTGDSTSASDAGTDSLPLDDKSDTSDDNDENPLKIASPDHVEADDNKAAKVEERKMAIAQREDVENVGFAESTEKENKVNDDRATVGEEVSDDPVTTEKESKVVTMARSVTEDDYLLFPLLSREAEEREEEREKEQKEQEVEREEDLEKERGEEQEEPEAELEEERKEDPEEERKKDPEEERKEDPEEERKEDPEEEREEEPEEEREEEPEEEREEEPEEEREEQNEEKEDEEDEATATMSTKSVSIFRPWAEQPMETQAAAAAAAEPRFLTWAEMVVPSTLPQSLCVVSGEAKVHVEAVVRKFVEWSEFSSNEQQQHQRSPRGSESRNSIHPSNASISNGSDLSREGEVVDDDDEDDDDTSEDNDGVKYGSEVAGIESTERPSRSEADAFPTVPGWMQNLKPRNKPPPAKKRRRTMPKS